MGTAHNPNTWLDKRSRFSSKQQKDATAHASVIRTLVEEEYQRRNGVVQSEAEVTSKAHQNLGPDDPDAEEPLEGGPKTAESPPESVPSNRLLTEVDISADLEGEQPKLLEKVIERNAQAFRLDGRLGNYPVQVDISMKPDAVPVSLAPFPASPKNREVIDDQIDAWLALDVIETSKSPWAAPVFIVYRNGKARMVIDLRKLNESAISDEHPEDFTSSNTCHSGIRTGQPFFNALCKRCWLHSYGSSLSSTLTT